MTPEFYFATLDGSSFKAIDALPNGIDADNLFTVSVGTNNLGQFAARQAVDFISLTGGPVGEFKVSGINPQVDAASPTAFPIKLSFLTEYADFVMSSEPLPEFALPSPWVSDDVGTPALAGLTTFTNGTFTVTGSGNDIWETADAFQFAYRRVSGDCEIVARVASLEPTDPWAKAGVMIRESLEAGSANAYSALSKSNGINFQFRFLTNAPTYAAPGQAIRAPGWMKLKRVGNRFTGYASTNGSAWTQMGSTEIIMANDIYVGLAVSSHNTNLLNSAEFDSVSVNFTSDPTPEPQRATLVHRYSFSEATNSTTVLDSVGTSHGTVVNSKGTNFNGSGQFSMSGGIAGDANATFIDLPDGLISSLQSVTIEGWVTWMGPTNSVWQRVFDFGRSTAGLGVGYMFLTPSYGLGNNSARFAIRPDTGDDILVLENNTTFAVRVPTHFAVAYDRTNAFAVLYVNGQPMVAGAALSPLRVVEDVNVWLGRSQWSDPFFNGSFDEFRIYDGPLSDAEVVASFAAGPNRILLNPRLGARFTGTSFELSWPLSKAVGFTLQSASQIGGPWSTASVPLVTNQGVVKVVVPLSPSATSGFYQLKK